MQLLKLYSPVVYHKIEWMTSKHTQGNLSSNKFPKLKLGSPNQGTQMPNDFYKAEKRSNIIFLLINIFEDSPSLITINRQKFT